MYDLFHILSLWQTYGSMECVCVCGAVFMYVFMYVYVCMYACMYEGWNFNSGNYLFTTDTK